MPNQPCRHNIEETLKGSGPCQISAEVKRRNGLPNWWCKTHHLDASAPDGAALESCPGAWFDSVPPARQCEVDATDGTFRIWGGVPPAIQIGQRVAEQGQVHVHHRPAGGSQKDVDGSFNIVTVHNGSRSLVVENMAAVAFSVSELAGQPLKVLACPKPTCSGLHIDEQKFATKPHSKHLCNTCGRNFRDQTPSISNPLAAAYETLGLERPPTPQPIERRLDLDRTKFSSISIWPSNAAIVSNTTEAEDEGIHVHAWDLSGKLTIDETYAPVSLDGGILDPEVLRALAVQRAVAHHGTPIISMACDGCGQSLVSPSAGWIEPVTRHTCPSCGTVTRSRRRVFLNPLADKQP